MATSFVVYGHPMPKGSKTRMPNGMMIDAAPSRAKDKEKRAAQRQKMRVWPELVEAAAYRQLPDSAILRWPYDDAVNITCVFYLEHPRKVEQRSFHTKKPDLDKLIRGVLDPMKKAGLITDDCIAVSFDGSRKLYARKGAGIGDPDGPRVEITVTVV